MFSTSKMKRMITKGITRRNFVHFDHIFATIMRLMSKPTNFTTSSVLVLRVHVVAISSSHICNYRKG